MKTNSKSKKAGCFAYVFILFGIPFALVGIFLGIKSVKNFSDSYEMKNWEQIPSEIISVKLNENQSDKSTTYSVDAVYQYQFSGKNYKGSRINITGGGESGSYYPTLYKKLSKFKKSKKKYLCFVNPGNPAESILNNKLRTVDIIIFPTIAVLFSGIGIGIIAFGIFNIKKEKIYVALQEKNPDKPWLQKPDWVNGKIKSSNKTMVYFSLFFSLFWNLISWPIAITFTTEILKNKNYEMLWILLFPAVGIGLVIWFAISLIRWRKYGESFFVMESVPGVIGGVLKGIIITKVKIRSDSRFEVELNCVNKHTSGRGKNRRTSERILWQNVLFIKQEAMEGDLTQTAIPVLFKIPFEVRETNEENPSDKIIWRLKIRAEVPGVDYSAHFEIPVFKTKDSRKDFEVDESVLNKYVEKTTGDALLKSSGIISEKLINGGAKFVFPAAGKKAIPLLLFNLVWGGMVMFLWKIKSPPMMIKIIFTAVQPLLIYGFLDRLLYKSEIAVSKGSITILNGWIGFRSERIVLSSDIEEIKLINETRSGQKLSSSIIVITNSGKKFTVARRIANLHHAEYIIEETKNKLGL
ncbi:MAG: hypothetical protein DRI44_01075 [Chlamydiae bacterium]|nr:MAG: hypothetical protein DRI44_01075 [Chlamydiota bacterium]